MTTLKTFTMLHFKFNFPWPLKDAIINFLWALSFSPFLLKGPWVSWRLDVLQHDSFPPQSRNPSGRWNLLHLWGFTGSNGCLVGLPTRPGVALRSGEPENHLWCWRRNSSPSKSGWMLALAKKTNTEGARRAANWGQALHHSSRPTSGEFLAFLCSSWSRHARIGSAVCVRYNFVARK